MLRQAIEKLPENEPKKPMKVQAHFGTFGMPRSFLQAMKTAMVLNNSSPVCSIDHLLWYSQPLAQTIRLTCSLWYRFPEICVQSVICYQNAHRRTIDNQIPDIIAPNVIDTVKELDVIDNNFLLEFDDRMILLEHLMS